MIEYDSLNKRLLLKLVYYGPALSGKTTNLLRLHDLLSHEGQGDLMVLDTTDDRTIFFDLLPLFYGEQESTQNDYDSLYDLEPIDEIDILLEEDDQELAIAELISSSRIPPIIRIVNAIISEALRYRASDIHIEPKSKYTRGVSGHCVPQGQRLQPL